MDRTCHWRTSLVYCHVNRLNRWLAFFRIMHNSSLTHQPSPHFALGSPVMLQPRDGKRPGISSPVKDKRLAAAEMHNLGASDHRRKIPACITAIFLQLFLTHMSPDKLQVRHRHLTKASLCSGMDEIVQNPLIPEFKQSTWHRPVPSLKDHPFFKRHKVLATGEYSCRKIRMSAPFKSGIETEQYLEVEIEVRKPRRNLACIRINRNFAPKKQ